MSAELQSGRGNDGPSAGKEPNAGRCYGDDNDRVS